MINLSLAELQQAYRQGTTTPRALLLSLRQQALNLSDHNMFITLLSEEALLTYLAALDGQDPANLPLYGVPFAIKDNLDLAGVPTTAACPAFAYTPATNARTVQILLDAGAIPLGKTNLDQFATGLNGTRSPYGQVPNAFLPEYISGGSSSGSAVATALGLVSFALGTDTAGSGRVPAALNNLVGVKPTKGILSNTGLVPACKSLDCVSIFALNCDDAACLLHLLAQYDKDDPYSRRNPYTNRKRYYPASIGAFKFGIPQLDLSAEPETLALFHAAQTRLMSIGGQPVSIDFSPFLAAAQLLYQGPWIAERKLATAGINPADMLPVIADVIVHSPDASASAAFHGLYQLAELKRQCDLILAEVDVIITPPYPRAYTRAEIDQAPMSSNSNLGTYTNFMNLLDYAALAVPVGFTAKGLPYGITLFGPAFSDTQLLSLGREFHAQSGLPQGATNYSLPGPLDTFANPPVKTVDVLVCGAHMTGEPLNWQLTDRDATLKAITHTAPGYKLYALPDGKRPALVRSPETPTGIATEVWQIPTANLGSFLACIAPPLGLGRTQLEDGSWVTGFICEPIALEGALDITEFGGWRAWKAARKQ